MVFNVSHHGKIFLVNPVPFLEFMRLGPGSLEDQIDSIFRLRGRQTLILGTKNSALEHSTNFDKMAKMSAKIFTLL